MRATYSKYASIRALLKGHVTAVRALKSDIAKAKKFTGEDRDTILCNLDFHRSDFRSRGRALHLTLSFLRGTPFVKAMAPNNWSTGPEGAREVLRLIRSVTYVNDKDVYAWMGVPGPETRTVNHVH